MLRPDLYLRPTAATAATTAAAASTAVRIMPSSSAFSDDATDFAATFGEVHADVMDFIENGSQHGDVPSISSLSVEGSAYRNIAQPVNTESMADVGPAQQEFL